MIYANALAAGAYFIVFAATAFRHARFQWLWFSIALWLVAGMFSGQLMPGVLGITHSANLYLAHFYFFIGSVFFWLNDVSAYPPPAAGQPEKAAPRKKHKPKCWQGQAGGLLTLFALASLVQHIALLVLAAVAWQMLHVSLFPYGASAMLEMYALRPLVWLLFTAFSMLVARLHQMWLGQPENVFSADQIFGGITIALIMQAAYCYESLLSVFMRH